MAFANAITSDIFLQKRQITNTWKYLLLFVFGAFPFCATQRRWTEPSFASPFNKQRAKLPYTFFCFAIYSFFFINSFFENFVLSHSQFFIRRFVSREEKCAFFSTTSFAHNHFVLMWFWSCFSVRTVIWIAHSLTADTVLLASRSCSRFKFRAFVYRISVVCFSHSSQPAYA